jgi:curved DNA-binding protein CbpA
MRALAPSRLAAVALRASAPRRGVRRLARPVRASASARDGDVIFDAYEILDVRDDATAIDIKDRYRDLQKRFHPDVSGDDPEVLGRSAAINRAYELLIDKDRRRDLDDALMRANGGKRRDRTTHGGGRAIASAFGLVGPLRERLLARMESAAGSTRTRARATSTSSRS